jgi:hypothetical protein
MNKICQQILNIKAYYLHFNLVYKVQLLLNNNQIDLIHKRIYILIKRKINNLMIVNP